MCLSRTSVFTNYLAHEFAASNEAVRPVDGARALSAPPRSTFDSPFEQQDLS